jgi:hypothetical protein
MPGTTGTCHLTGHRDAPEADAWLWDWDDGRGRGARRQVLTTDHPASRYGLPVLLVDGEPYGPDDLPPGVRLGTVDADQPEEDRPLDLNPLVPQPTELKRAARSQMQRQDRRTDALRAAAMRAGYRLDHGRYFDNDSW